MFESPFAESIVARARVAGQIELAVHDIRQWATDRHHVVDDAPYGGGAGMVLKPEPLTRAIRATKGERGHVLLMSAQGPLFDQAAARRLAELPRLVLVCGHYEGRDERAIDRAGLTPAERARLPRPPTRDPVSVADLKAAYGSGVGSYRIAARFGISPATVRARLRAAGVRLRPPRSGQRGPTVAEVTKMRGAGLTIRALARHFGVSHVTILDRLKKAKR